MANDKVFQKLVKGHCQGHLFKIYGTIGKVLSQGTHMPNMKVLSLRILDMCLRNMDAPGGKKVKIWQKSLSYILTPPHPQGHMMPVKCENSIDELTVQVWLLYHHPNFKYCTLFVGGRELRTDRNRQTDRRTIRLLDAPGRPFRPGA